MISRKPSAQIGKIELADLISLGKIRIEVLFAIPLGHRRNRTVQGQSGADRKFNGLFVHHRQGAGKSKADRADLRVGRCAELRAASAEQFRLGLELNVDLETDDGFDGVSVGMGHGIGGFKVR